MRCTAFAEAREPGWNIGAVLFDAAFLRASNGAVRRFLPRCQNYPRTDRN